MLLYLSIINVTYYALEILETTKKNVPVRPIPFPLSLSFFFLDHSYRTRGRILLMQTCGGGTCTREGVLVSTIIRVSSRRMSFINARGKLRPYTCIYTRMGRREIERETEMIVGGDDEEGWGKEWSERYKGGRREKTTEAKYPSFCFVPGGWVPLRVPSLAPPIIIIFYHNICFSHILFYVNGRSLLLPAPPLCLSLSPSPLFPLQPPIPSRRPSLRMHGLGELLAFCLEFKKFFHPPSTTSSRRDAPRPPSRRATLVVVVTYLFRFVSCTPTCALRSILSRKHKRGKI